MHTACYGRFLGACLIWWALIGTAQATVIVDMDVEELTLQATHVVHARILSQRAERLTGRIDTRMSIEVIQWVKHPNIRKAPEIFSFYIPGGQIGELAQLVPGTPTYQVGEEVVLFLWQRDEETPPRLLGLSQGSYRVEPTAEGKRAVRDRRGLALMRRTPEGRFLEQPEQTAEEKLPLNRLLERAQKALERRSLEKGGE